MAGAGDKVGGFSLVRQLGAGGMGETWEAVRTRDHGFEQRVAIKLASRSVLETQEGLALFRREASLAASLRHPNIASVLDVDEQRGYLIYELIDGADLRSVLRETQGQPSTALIVYVMGQIARGLAHAHRRVLHGQLSPVVHRDMSPGNVVVDYDGNLKIVDFGIAKATALSERSESIKGKLAYMSPEQVTGGTVDGRVDQYALGVIAYEAVAGVRPNDGAHDGETLAKILHGDHIPIAKRVPSVPAGLGEIIERMLAVDPDDRFASMDEVIDALAAFNPPLTTYRELAALVYRSKPPQTIVLRGGAYVSVPVDPSQVRASQAPGVASAAEPPLDGLPQHVQTESLVRAEPPSPRSDLEQARTLLGEDHSPGATALRLELAARTPGPTDDLAKRARSRWLAVAGAFAIGMIGWAVSQKPFATTSRSPDTSGAATRAAPSSVRPSPPVALPPPPSENAAVASPPLNIDVAAPAAAPSSPVSSDVLPKPSRRNRKPSTTEREAPAADPLAKVRVKVFPWGQIWIDGTKRGEAPPIFVAELPAGTHEVAAGHEKPMETKRVTLTAGELETVSFDLEDGKP